jgi:hypothetical protein
MLNNTALSAWSIFLALVGILMNALFTRPYTGASYTIPMKKIKWHKCKEWIGRVANVFIVIGTLGQLVSILKRF